MFLPSFMGFDKAGFGDPDALAFFARVTAAGGSLTTTEKSAVNTLVVNLKGYGIWTAMKAIYPMVGASAAACAQNLKSASFTGTFSSGWTFASTGATPNGTSAFLNSNFSMPTNLSANNNHISFYSRTQNSSVSGINIGGAYLNGSNEVWMSVYYAGVAQKVYVSGQYALGYAFVNNTNTLGLHIGSQLSTVSRKLYFAGSLVATTTTLSTNVYGTGNIYIGAHNNGSAVLFMPHECAFSTIGDGLTDTQSSNLYTAVQAFQTTLSRQV